jgi:hypothetical protein
MSRCGWSRTIAVGLMRPAFLQGSQRLRRHMVETDENRTRIVRVQTGCSPVELQPRKLSKCRDQGGRACRSPSEARQRRAAGIPLDSLRRGGAARAAPRERAATEDRTRISSLARSRLAIGPWPHDGAPVRTCTGTGRLRNGCSATRAAGTLGARRATSAHRHFAPAEGFEPSSFPVTVGRLTVRPR